MYVSVYEELPEAPPPSPDCAHESSYRQLGCVLGKGYDCVHTCRCGAKWRIWLSRPDPSE